MSHFRFLAAEWPLVADAADRAGGMVKTDPRGACFYARRAMELAVHWIYKNDASVELPYQDNLSALIHEPTFKAVVGPTIFAKAKLIVYYGNQAVHSPRPISEPDGFTAVKELFHVGFWLARTYARGAKPPADLSFDPALLPDPRGEAARAQVDARQTAEQLKALEAELRARDERLGEVLKDREALDAELKRAREEVARAKAAAAATPDDHDYTEAETRNAFIDLLLKEAGWPLDQARDREFEVTGMPNGPGKGYVDYVLWGDDGKPLAVVEAKRTRKDPRVGQQQAKLYADCLERQFGQRPLIFYSNGYEHWFWDDTTYPHRPTQGFYTKDEMARVVQRRTTRKVLAEGAIDTEIAGRYYQTRAIRKVCEAFEKDKLRKSLLVMATGSGKTRTVIALADLLMKSNWVKRVLFLADRVALVKQAVNAFKKHLPETSPVNLVTEKRGEGRVFCSTYPTMMGLINETQGEERRFGVGAFDLVIIDEAHRSVFQKYRSIFEYFDSFLVGLTATPRDEIDRNTYGLFELEAGVPTDAYDLDEAVRDKFLVPPKAISVPLKFQREGIKYDELSEEEREEWDSLEWDEGEPPDEVGSEAMNRWLFNQDTVDKVLENLMTKGIRVAGGDRLGKSILFAKNQRHAEFIEARFNANFPHLKGHFARIISFKADYAQSLIEAFEIPDKDPHLAISVDMLDTGIDVPDVVNLVFFKVVRSKTKFWQMVGRGTRLRPDLFGPGQDKTHFCIFDFCQNLEYFSAGTERADPPAVPSLSARLFRARLDLIKELDGKIPGAAAGSDQVRIYDPPEDETAVRIAVAQYLHREVSAMNVDNFVVRPKRRLVERFSKSSAWKTLTDPDRLDLSNDLAGLPTEMEPEDEEAKRFDLLMLRLELSVLGAQKGFDRLKESVLEIVDQLEQKAAIPAVRECLPLIQEIQGPDWWQDLGVPAVENARLRLRGLMKLMDRSQRTSLYTNFADEIGDGVDVDFAEVKDPGINQEKFRAKAQAFLREHLEIPAVKKLRSNDPLTPADLNDLERILVNSGIGGEDEWQRVKIDKKGLGVFVRSLVGLERDAAKRAFGEFLTGKTLNPNQVEFINLIVNHLTENGLAEPEVLYESPFTDLAPTGPEGLFKPEDLAAIFRTMAAIRERAIAA